MRENLFKAAFAVVVAGLTTYFKIMIIPLAVLMSVMILDYFTGMVKAWITKTINSCTGLIGIVKKLCYLLVVCVGGVVDWLIQTALSKSGVTYNSVYFVGLLVVIWLIINELISILENMAIIGVPLPSFLSRVIKKLKIAIENQAKSSADHEWEE